MRAAVLEHYGPPEALRIAEVPEPEPGPRDVLVRVRAAAVTSGDARIRGARFPAGFGLLSRLALGVRGPRHAILGSSFAGVVEAVGTEAGRLETGLVVCGMTGMKLGAHAEYLAVRADRVVLVPSGVSTDDAAGVLFGGTAALFFLRDKASVAPGMTVLVNGASGAVGTNAVQLATHFGATVTGVTSAANADLATRLGADHVIDYSTTDLFALRDRFDVVIDCVGNIAISSGRKLLADRGFLVLTVASLWEMVRARGHIVAGSAPERAADFDLLVGLVARGEIAVVHDSFYDLDGIVEAHRRVDTGHKRGNVIVRP